MNRNILFVFVAILLLPFKLLHMQEPIIADNLYAFGFSNVFDWNIVILDSKSEENHIRMVMYESIDSIKDKVIVCSFSQFDESKLSKILDNKDNKIVKKLKNPYSEENIFIIQSFKGNQVNALISHFGYLLTVSYRDSGTPDMVKFEKLIKSYINVKLEL
jgi:hypothetical protein